MSDDRHVPDSPARRRPGPTAVIAAALALLLGAGLLAVRSLADRGPAPSVAVDQAATTSRGADVTARSTPPTPTPSADVPTVAAGRPAGPADGDGQGTATAFLTAWQGGDWARMQALVLDPSDDMTRVYGGLSTRLHVTRTQVRPGAWTPGPDAGRLAYHVTLTLDGLGDAGWDSAVDVARAADGWRVRFTAPTLYPGLQVGQRLDLVPGGDPALTDRRGRPLTDDAELAANLVGHGATDTAGASGLVRVLAGQGQGPGTALAVVDAVTGQRAAVVAQWHGGRVATTLDLDVQRAAERALAGAPGPAALVAIDTATGEVRAMADRPSSGVPASIGAAVAPGSTFKIVTATAALLAGQDPAATVQCTPSVTVGGRTIVNHEGQQTGPMSLTTAFAVSCNTAFVRLAAGLPASAVHDAAALYGFDGGAPLPIASVGGSAPLPANAAETAEGAIGQGRVTASPLQLASVAAAVADGTWRQPHVLPCPACAAHPVPVAGTLRTMMRAVVTRGTATQLAGLPDVYGKTGTAEYGGGSPPATHAWFVGWQGRTAFAVLVHDGVSGSAVAVPVAATFLRALGS